MLDKQLQEQIRQQSKSYARKRFDEVQHQKRLHRKTLIMYAYQDGANGYAEQLQSASQRIEQLEKALKAIADWELPATGRYWDKEKTDPMSYEACHGSTGVKEYFMKLASEVLNNKNTADDTE